jgi:hypothetical protein
MGNAGRAQGAATKASLLAQLTSLAHRFPSAIQDIAAHAASAQQHANNAAQAAQAGNLAGSYAEMMAAINDLEAAGHQAFDIGDIAQGAGDPAGKGARDGAVEALVAVEDLAKEAAAENSGGGGGDTVANPTTGTDRTSALPSNPVSSARRAA